MSNQLVLRIVFVLAFLGAGLWSSDGRVAAEVVTVGPAGSDCDFTLDEADPIGRALEAINPVATEIRLVRLPDFARWVEDLPPIARSVTIRGGFDNCASAASGDENTSALSGVSPVAGRFLTVNPASGQEVVVRLRRIGFSDCGLQGLDSNWPGGAIQVNGPGSNPGSVSVYIERSTFTGCQAAAGGAIALNGGAELFVGDFSVIQEGDAVRGGAVHCQASTVYLGPGSNLTSNHATEDGGGLYADNCTVTVLSRRSDASPLRNNTANRHGGFLYASNASRIFVDGGANCERQPNEFSAEPCDPAVATLIRGNRANLEPTKLGMGGAIYASGQNTAVSADGVVFEDNSAWLGGAIASSVSASLELGRTSVVFRPGQGCGLTPCVEFLDNRAGARGGAVFLDGAGPVVLWFAEFRGNSANFGSAISLNNQPASAPFDMANSIFAGNGDVAEDTVDFGLVEFNTVGQSDAAGHEVNLTGLTIADNPLIMQALFYSQTQANVDRVSLRGSVLIGDTPVRSLDLDGILGDCIASDSTLPPGFTNSIDKDDNVSLVDVAGRDYRPSADSPAIDLCAPAQMPGVAGLYDFLHNPREKAGSVSNLATPNDAGALEVQLELNDDEVFQDRFQQSPPPT
jgi:predicted outer membrane repeat protein